jgi:hypothetical protein
MEPRHIKLFLEKAHSLLGTNDVVKEKTVEVIKEKIGIELTSEKIRVKNKIITIEAHPAVKNEVLLRKKELLNALSELGLGKQVIDIK